ncbi:histidine kinase dimerization/phosphoacceptor domain -containing protein [Algibacter miyuki]|uniref:histidine kinase n=1 Tax=Algibacter miyuki TaxID=1306933 RepID=A0ABV5GX51_9FLAO|nr:histidine kinase dimerization/phosphoacceptor domain -containing protein [Algibacter miyuki]MDN3664309.1 histidine kinase dimerization/phosphoacceptor domain -containing protein [Algibacter miyuki]
MLFGFLTFGQDAKPDAYQDSLQSIIDSSFKKEQRKDALFLLGQYLVQRNPQLAEKIATELKNEHLINADSAEVRRNNYIFAASHRWQGDYATALNYYHNIYQYSKKHQDSMDIASSSHFIGTLNTFLGNNVVAQKHLIEVSEIYDAIGTVEQKAKINNSLAGFYLNIDQLKKGEEQYLKALEQYEILQDSGGLASVHANLGLLYTDLNEFKKAERHLMKQKGYNAVFPTLREMGFHYDFLGLLRQKQERLQDAYQEHFKALKIRENLSSTYNLCESKLNMGEILIKLKRYPEAIVHLKDVFKYDEHKSLYQQQRAYQLLSEANEKSGHFKDALSDFKAFKELSDSIYSKESIEIIAEKDAQYSQQKQENKIALLNNEKKISEEKASRSKVIALLTSIGLLWLIMAAIALYKMYSKINHKNQIITKALKDRELLLHETHHRVKNNLQLISSLLNLQSKYVVDEKVYEVLQNGRNRVQSMAILHKNLYVGEELDMINIQNYFEGLVENILNSYNKSEEDMAFNIQAKDIVMDVESVIPIGLIVNELVTNALKHAFPLNKTKKPSINIIMLEHDNDHQLIVKDNGIGFDEKMKNKAESFGQRLISLFTNKLKATVVINSQNGTEVSIVFPKANATVR